MRVPVAAACSENESCRRMGKPVRRFFCVCQSSGLVIGLILFLTSQISVQLSVGSRCVRLLGQLQKGHLNCT